MKLDEAILEELERGPGTAKNLGERPSKSCFTTRWNVLSMTRKSTRAAIPVRETRKPTAFGALMLKGVSDAAGRCRCQCGPFRRDRDGLTSQNLHLFQSALGNRWVLKVLLMSAITRSRCVPQGGTGTVRTRAMIRYLTGIGASPYAV